MTRDELVKACIMDAIADDYEDLEQIAKYFGKYWKSDPVSEDEILAGLRNLIQAGLATAYALSTTEPARALPGFPDPAILAECWFYLTERGKAVLLQLPDDLFLPSPE